MIKWALLDMEPVCRGALFSPKFRLNKWMPTLLAYIWRNLEFINAACSPTHFALFWDTKKNLRKEKYPWYKGNRAPKEEQLSQNLMIYKKCMIKIREEMFSKSGITNSFCFPGYESDDLIASACKGIKRATTEAVVVSNDKDLYQLIRPHISFFDIGKHVLLTDERFKKLYKYKARDYWKVKALAGCKSDTVPGVKGIGEKTAGYYINGTLKRGKVWDKIQTEEAGKIIHRNVKLVRLPYEGTPKIELIPTNWSWNKLQNIFESFGFLKIGKEKYESKGFGVRERNMP